MYQREYDGRLIKQGTNPKQGKIVSFKLRYRRKRDNCPFSLQTTNIWRYYCQALINWYSSSSKHLVSVNNRMEGELKACGQSDYFFTFKASSCVLNNISVFCKVFCNCYSTRPYIIYTLKLVLVYLYHRIVSFMCC